MSSHQPTSPPRAGRNIHTAQTQPSMRAKSPHGGAVPTDVTRRSPMLVEQVAVSPYDLRREA